MLSLTSDYQEGAHPEILRRLAETNLTKTPGYGTDEYCESARAKIREACESGITVVGAAGVVTITPLGGTLEDGDSWTITEPNIPIYSGGGGGGCGAGHTVMMIQSPHCGATWSWRRPKPQ